MKCYECETEVNDDCEFCPACGKKIKHNKSMFAAWSLICGGIACFFACAIFYTTVIVPAVFGGLAMLFGAIGWIELKLRKESPMKAVAGTSLGILGLGLALIVFINNS